MSNIYDNIRNVKYRRHFYIIILLEFLKLYSKIALERYFIKKGVKYMTQLHPYLSFDKAKDALEYYEDVFGATNVNRLAVGEEQAENFGLTKEQGEKATMHAEFEILGVKILCSDSFGRVDNINNGISLLIDFDTNDKTDSERVENFYNKIKDHESINIEMPLEEQFWGGKMGTFTDKYGVRWMLNGQDYSQMN